MRLHLSTNQTPTFAPFRLCDIINIMTRLFMRSAPVPLLAGSRAETHNTGISLRHNPGRRLPFTSPHPCNVAILAVSPPPCVTVRFRFRLNSFNKR
ncbi:unnamed protein product [Protopolystoma xenopodis]|uniref:Uncharacterized protein n=1 Tax=Protopolystoma xenopodis TaxID=117903 RepID=A0A3S5ALK2_9PLAT|nr:unnamed protein product [Protopolystoma xenopodis]